MADIVRLHPHEEPSEEPFVLIECDPKISGVEQNRHTAGVTYRTGRESFAAMIADAQQKHQTMAKIYVREPSQGS